MIVAVLPVLGENGTAQTKIDLSNSRRVIGVGLALTTIAERNAIVVIGVPEGTPAREANICHGDILLAVNGKPVNANDLNYVVSQISGPVGTNVTITIEHDGVERNIMLTRREFSIPPGGGCSQKKLFIQRSNE